jgi:hypothetical protein
LRRQVPGKAVEHLGGAFLAQHPCLRAVDTVQVSAMSDDKKDENLHVLTGHNGRPVQVKASVSA